MVGEKTQRVTLTYIFLTFLKLGCISFGGFMALIALVQRQLVDIDKKMTDEEILDGVSLASILPGPVAVNTITYVGQRLRGISGALVAWAGIILPSFVIVVILSWLYFSYGHFPILKNFFAGVMPVVTALIITVSWRMAEKNIHTKAQWLIVLLSGVTLISCKGFLTTALLLLTSGLIGAFLFHKSEKEKYGKSGRFSVTRAELAAFFLFIVFMTVMSCLPLATDGQMGSLSLLSVFSRVSVTLFGGGYVVIPALHELFVNDLHWLSAKEFADGIAMGQVTPGPIFITATFIGYKISGIWGAMVATVAMFAPPACLIVMIAHFERYLKQSLYIKAAFSGLRAAVIGMVFVSAITIGRTIDINLLSIILFVVALFISFRYKTAPVFLILGGGMAGIMSSLIL